jgi:stage V sporulation protein AF
MKRLSDDYKENVAYLSDRLGIDKSFDLISRRLLIGPDELTLYYIDGFVKDGVTQRLMQFYLGQKDLGSGPDAAQRFADVGIPYVEVDLSEDADQLVLMVLSGATVMLGSTFGAHALIVDTRTYPARSTDEPQSDKVLQGARDGFVETLIFNTALIRRRIRDPHLIMHYQNLGGASGTDIVVCYMEGRADEKFVKKLTSLLASLRPDSLTLGYQSLAEILIPRRWYNPFPKIRTTERPDCAAAHLVEGSVLVLCDTSPQVMILPTSIFDFLQESEDFYLPPLTGSYLRMIRFITFFVGLFLTPTWYLLISYPSILPPWLSILIPDNPGTLPIIVQLFLVEFAIDGLKLASMNTPNLLANSMSVIGGLILGDFAVGVGWLSPDAILYMAIVAIAGFTQQNNELGYAFKFLRMLSLVLTAIFGWIGYAVGVLLVPLLLATNRTVNGSRSYLYPLIPFNGRALLRLLFRLPKRDFTLRRDEKNSV